MPHENGKLLLTGHTNAGYGGSWLRIRQPLESIRAQGLAHCHYLSKKDVPEVLEKAILASDVMVSGHGVSPAQADYVLDLMAQGKKYVWDVDDLPDQVSPYNPSYRQFGLEEVELDFGDRREWLWKDGERGFDIERNHRTMSKYLDVLRAASALSTTQEYLAGKLLKLNSRVFLRPNVLDFTNIFRRKARPTSDGIVRIMYMGGCSHLSDIQTVLPVLEAIAKDFPHTQFIFFGDTKGPAEKFIPPERIRHMDWSGDYKMYAIRIAAASPDIGIAPLSEEEPFVEFNKCKSCLKWLDYAGVGVPCVAQDMTPYKEAINFRRAEDIHWNGILAKTPEDWYAALAMLIQNPEARQIIGQNAYAEARENWSAEKHAPTFFRQFEEVAHG